MFDELYPDAQTAARHKAGPFAEDRMAFLADRAGQGYRTSTLRWSERDGPWRRAWSGGIQPTRRTNDETELGGSQGQEARSDDAG